MYLFSYEVSGFDDKSFSDTGIIHGSNLGEAVIFLTEYYGDTINELKVEYATGVDNAPLILSSGD